jgi:outer membrane receptor protein involved in Fe transport
VTNPPDPKKLEGAVSVGGVTVDKGTTEALANGFVNVPFWDEKAAFRLSAVVEGVPGWIDNTANGDKDVNHGTKHSVRASVLLKPDDAWKIRATVFDQVLEAKGGQSTQVVGSALTPTAPPPNKFDQIDGYNNQFAWPHHVSNHLTYYALNVEYGWSAATFMSSTSYGEIKNSFTADFSNLNLAPGVTYADFLSAAVYNTPMVMAQRQTEFLHKFNQEFRLTSNPGSTLFDHGLDWQGGAYFSRETLGLNQFFDARDAANTQTVLAPPLGGANIPADYNEWAVFADFTYHFTETFDLELGGRESGTKQHSQVSLYCCVLFGPDNVYPKFDSSENKFTWSVAPRWHITPDTMLYARVATGYRPGGPNLPTPTLPNPPNMLPDSTRNYELGLRSELLNRTVSIDVAVFYIDWKDVQILSLVETPSGPVGINGNSGTARSAGVEWNLAWMPIQGLTLSLLGAYTDAKLTSDAPGLGAMDGDKLPFVPDVTTTLNIDYSWRAFGGFDGNVGGSWTYMGTQYTGFSPSPPVEAHVKLPTYNTLKLQAGIDNGKWNAQIYGANLTNEKGISTYANFGGPNQTGQATFIQPRTFGLQVGMKF